MWSRSVPLGEVRRLGDCAFLIGVANARAARALIEAIEAAPLVGSTDVVGGLASVMVALDRTSVGPSAMTRCRRYLERLVSEVGPTGGSNDPGASTSMPEDIACVFDGPDLFEVAERAGCRVSEVVDRLTAVILTVAVVGFSPGFAYLEGLPDELASIPRRARPRPVVPAGSVALAGGHAAVYPSASPGGWQLIGRTSESFFDPWRPPYARLAPGDRVRFSAHSTLGTAPARRDGVARDDDHAQAVFMVEEPGLRTVRQDGGRRGVARLGVPGAGPADGYAWAVANRLVGNRADAAALEITAKGPTLRCLRPTFVAVVGAEPVVTVDGQRVSVGAVMPVVAGQRVEVGVVRAGLRTYFAVAGGFDGPEVFESSATDQLCGLGPGPLHSGDVLTCGPLTPPLGDHVRLAGRDSRLADGARVLRVVPGPHHEHFVDGAFAALRARRFIVEGDSNRIGVRLRPLGEPSSLREHGARGVELDSHGACTGAVQVPPDGVLVVLGPDHATLGGYPIVGVVASADLGWLGQCAPGDLVALEPITFAEADRAWTRSVADLDSAVVGHYPLAVD